MQNSPLNYWHVSNSLTTYCFLKEKYPPKPIKVYISFDLENIPDPYFTDRLSSLCNELWHEYYLGPCFLHVFLLTFVTIVDVGIQISCYIRASWPHRAASSDLPPSNLLLSKHLSMCCQISLARFCSDCEAAWAGRWGDTGQSVLRVYSPITGLKPCL